MNDRVEVWREAFVRHYEMPDLPPLLEARGRVFRLGKAVLSDTLQPRSFVRDKAQARRDGANNILISVELSEGIQLATEDGEQDVAPGRVTLFDVAQAVAKRGSHGRTLVMGVAREIVEDALPGLNVHGLTLEGSGGSMLAQHIRSLRAHLPSTEQAAAPHLVSSTLHMLAACVLPTADRLQQARPALTEALLTRAKRYIRQNARDATLSPDSVAVAVGASRASLYRAFEPEGGVAELIRKVRLEAARAALLDPADPRRIGEIGFAHGFGSEAQFSRAIRATFGVSPREVRRGQGGLYVKTAEEKWVMKNWEEARARPGPKPAPARATAVPPSRSAAVS